MKNTNSPHHLKDLLTRLGYHGTGIQNILQELDILFHEIDFDELKQKVDAAQDAKDAAALIGSLKELMLRLENKGCYRPDYPTRLIKHLVNGLSHRNEDIFAILEKTCLPEKDKKKEQEFLASCAPITQLGYILLSCCLASEVKAASAGQHVFVSMDSFTPDSMIFVDFSIDSIIEVDASRYDKKENYYYLKNTEKDDETSKLLTQYYSFFHCMKGIGLSHNIHNNLSIAYERIGRYEDALEELRQALRLNPGYIEAHNNLAVTYDRMGKHDEALIELQEALRLNPNYTEAHSNLGSILARSGRYEEAAEELKQALKLNPRYAIAHNNLGHIYALQDKNNEAIMEFREALSINPEYASARNNLGSIYEELGRHEEALKEFQEALRLDPESPEAYHGIGLAYYSLGSYERAAQAFIRAAYLDHDILECVPEKLLLKVKQGVSRLRRD